MEHTEVVKLTQYAHGAGCGCKIDPQALEEILKSDTGQTHFPQLLVGNSSKDDAAVFQLNETEALIATTDFFTPIVNDAFTFGKVAAANAISDVYAMGGTPMLALAILGWPVEKLPASLAQQVLEGARTICTEANIPLAGGHSIDTPEPVFGLSVQGKVALRNLKKNNTAQENDWLLLSKPIGVGVLATAAKRDLISDDDLEILHGQLVLLNKIGAILGGITGVHALTDITGFGLAGHLIEMAEGSGLSAELYYEAIPKLALKDYLAKNSIPDATCRNWRSYSGKLQLNKGVNTLEAFQLLPDPQTNGGLLMAVAPDALQEVQEVLRNNGYESFTRPIGKMIARQEKVIQVI